MKKLLLSLTVIAASGAYASFEHQAGGQPADGAPAEAAAMLPGTAPTAGAATPAAAALVLAPSPPAEANPERAAAPPPAAPPPVAERSPALPGAAPASPTPPAAPEAAPVAVAEAPPVAPLPETPARAATAPIPLPLPRPPEAPQIVAASSAPPAGQYRDGSYKGTSENAYYGRVQVDAVVRGGQIASIEVLQYPNDRRTSRYINGQALPLLEQEVIAAQSADVDVVSGATLTSEAYRRSLARALAGAQGNHA